MEFKLHHKIHTPEKQPFLSALSHYNLKGCFTPPFWSHRGTGSRGHGDRYGVCRRWHPLKFKFILGQLLIKPVHTPLPLPTTTGSIKIAFYYHSHQLSSLGLHLLSFFSIMANISKEFYWDSVVFKVCDYFLH